MTPNYLLRAAAETWESVSPFIFPPCCCLCLEPTLSNRSEPEKASVFEHEIRRHYATFCLTCETSIGQSRSQMRTACAVCGWPTGLQPNALQSDGQFEIDAGLPCPRCARTKHVHSFSRVTPLYRYQDAVTTAVVSAKYPRNSAVTYELARRLAGACLDRWPDLSEIPPQHSAEKLPPLVTSVPSPWLRQIRRGGSGSRLLGEFFAKEFRFPYHNLLKTTRSIAKQAWLEDEARRENVRGAFAVRKPIWYRDSLVRNRRIILIDDVMTTGATADEISRVLLDAGAESVSLAVVALAMRDS